MTFHKLLKWLTAFVVIGAGAAAFYFFATPTFSNDYKQLTARVEMGMKYTDPAEETIYFQPYIENPNPSSNITLTHSADFMSIAVLDEHGNVMEDSVTVKENNNDRAAGSLQTILHPGEQEENINYYKVHLPDEAQRLQVTFTGQVKDEFGIDMVDESIEINLNRLTM
ncbi:hypothetical protein [Salibacterium halotolerans]|uniref:Uncharacterized protein n=1 Tax=Salibacterium halotolerans TaxID=1884432 RepID=A0A1I5VA21_9BACI|nr:hypothetical protein [Salibacterium halotolerans]SFQ04261.1 hypothetical protein SAMN05518683_11585 [Salibacterium halotolerans]